MNTVKERFDAIRSRIRTAAERAGRDPATVHLLAVSKYHDVAAIAALAALGQQIFAESYVQEALDKQQQLADLDLQWHFIGPIQSNKTRAIASHFDWVHSVDRLKIARRLSDQRPAERPPLNIFIEVNIDTEVGKFGVGEDELPALIAACRELPGIRLCGLMCIPQPGSSNPFGRLAALRDRVAPALPYLSMGMSDDFEAAIEAGSTHVRVGTALFGPRA